MRFFNSLLLGASLITSLTAAIPIVGFGSNAELATRNSRELLVLRDVLHSSAVSVYCFVDVLWPYDVFLA